MLRTFKIQFWLPLPQGMKKKHVWLWFYHNEAGVGGDFLTFCEARQAKFQDVKGNKIIFLCRILHSFGCLSERVVLVSYNDCRKM